MHERRAAHDRNDAAEVDSDFSATYAATLRRHAESPTEQGLAAAYALGRRALDEDYSMLGLVGLHLDLRRALVIELGVDHLPAMDAFLSEALAAFEITQRGFVESQREAAAERNRAEWLAGLSDAYLAIASASTLDERTQQVCIEAKRFLGAADASLVFGRETADHDSDADVITAPLPGSAGRLSVAAPPGTHWGPADRTTLQQLAVLISAPIVDARRLEFAHRAGRLGALLGAVVEPDAIVTLFRDRGVAEIGADQAIVRLFGIAEPVSAEPARADAADPKELLDEVARTGEAIFQAAPDGEGPAWAVLPLGSPGPVGVLALGFDDSPSFDELQRSFLVDVSNRLTSALERGGVYARERSARQAAESASVRVSHLQDLAADLARAATRRRVAQVLLRRAAKSTTVVGGIVAVYNSSPQVDVLATSGLLADWDEPDDLVAAVVAARDTHHDAALPVIEVSDLPHRIRDRLAAVGLVGLARYPITAGQRAIGVLIVGWSDRSTTTPADGELLEAQVAMAGPTLLRAARYDVEHSIADTLQRSLLALPAMTLPRMHWSVHYRAGSAGLAGGDWYDLIELDPHRVGIAVGDLVGRGIEAAASMGQLRSATRALATRIADPAELIAALDDFTASTGQGRYSSLAYVVLDTRTGALAHSLAGHLPPILKLPDGSTSLLDTGRGPLLGLRCERHGAVRHVPPGTLLIMYTDGLVERRTESIDVGIDRLVATVHATPVTVEPDDLCRVLVEGLLPNDTEAGDSSDDVAIIAIRLTPDEAPGAPAMLHTALAGGPEGPTTG